MTEKSIILPNTDSDKVVIVGENEQAFQEVKWNIKILPGHTLFQINLETGDCTPAEYQQTDLQVNDFGPQANMHLQMAAVGKAIPNQEIKKKLITKPNCIYISALNISNAAKKFAKRCKEGGLIK